MYVISYDISLDRLNNASGSVEVWRVVPHSRVVHAAYCVYNHDLALFKIDPVVSPCFTPIEINGDPSNPVSREILTAMGYGQSYNGYPTKLQKVKQVVVDPDACKAQWAKVGAPIEPAMICSRGNSSTVSMRPCYGTWTIISPSWNRQG